MSKQFFIILVASFPFCVLAQGINVVPKPASVQIETGFFIYQKGLGVKMDEADEISTAIMAQFATSLFSTHLFTPPTATDKGKNIVLQLLTDSLYTAPVGSYRVRVFKDSVLIQAHSHCGLSFGCQTVKQLFFNSSLTHQIPCLEIIDSPSYAWRGLLLDVSRHFFSKQIILEYIDLLAALKMNVLHWHLTDDQGWRIEIKKYPKLTEVGAWRTEKNGSKYGGFYTQQDIKEIVEYAAQRYITIVPEIEMPGHSSAAIAAYPQLSCNPAQVKQVANTGGIKKDILCPTPFTFQFLKDVLSEVCELFPGRYIHIGGDEAPKQAWKKSSQAQALMQQNNLQNEEQLQHFFIQTIENYLLTKNKKAIGWGEIIKGGLSDSITVMSWLNKAAGNQAAKQGNPVIMTPRAFCYFDYPQRITDKKNAWWMLYLPLRKVYNFNPKSKALTAAQNKLILGGQANVWTESIQTEAQLKHQIIPRITALAEALWTPHSKKNYAEFKLRARSWK